MSRIIKKAGLSKFERFQLIKALRLAGINEIPSTFIFVQTHHSTIELFHYGKYQQVPQKAIFCLTSQWLCLFDVNILERKEHMYLTKPLLLPINRVIDSRAMKNFQVTKFWIQLECGEGFFDISMHINRSKEVRSFLKFIKKIRKSK